MMGRALRSRLDVMKPQFMSKQIRVPTSLEIREFKASDLVWVRCYMGASKWKQGVILSRIGPLCYFVEVEGRKWKRHIDQLKSRNSDSVTENTSRSIASDSGEHLLGHLPCTLFSRSQVSSQQPVPSQENVPSTPHVDNSSPVVSETPGTSLEQHCTTSPTVRRSTRVVKPPKRLDL